MRRNQLLLFFIIILLFASGASAQVQDDFSDGNFTDDPTWQGIPSNFIVNTSRQLQLNSPAAGDVYLSTANNSIQNMEWQFYIKLSFSPSNNNFTRIYLISDKSDLTQPLNGYFIHIGEAGSLDAIDLFRQDGISSTKIAAGVPGRAAKSTNELRIKVQRDSIGNWSIFSDTTGGTNFSAEGKAFDNRYTTSNFFGIFARVTASNLTKIVWDDFSIREITADINPPKLQSVQAVSAKELMLTFDEEISAATANNSSNYFVDKGIGNPAIATKISATNVKLIFSNSFIIKTKYNLQVSGIEDLVGNILVQQQAEFVYDVPELASKFDVLIHEIMADPEPVIALPNAEYIELFNRSNKTINLKNWTFSDPTATGIFPDFILFPDSFVIVCPSAAVTNLSRFGKVISLSRWPSLNNSGDSLILRNELGEVIHFVAYTDTWYKDDFKKNGGWSLEMMDANNPCAGAENWKSSSNLQGGTPGKLNSVKTFNSDAISPSLLRAVVENDTNITLYFSETIDEFSLINPANFSITPDVNSQFVSQPNSPWNNKTTLTLNRKLETRKRYELKLTGVKDCAGNEIAPNTIVLLGLPEPADSFDVVINEVLFNPKTGGGDFVELYNRSQKVINLSEFYLASADELNSFKDPKTITPQGYLLMPDDYVVLTTSRENLQNHYHVQHPEKVLEMSSLPSYPDKEGTVVLAKKNRQIIDRLSYNEKWHYALIQDKNGVSLEKLNPDLKTQKQENWHSAAFSVGYATPTYKNSQFMENDVVIKDKNVWIDPPVLSPDDDGYQDILSISYRFGNPGYTASINIFDMKGRPVKKLANNTSLSAEGNLFWDGLTDANAKAAVGIYIVLISVFHPEGETKEYKIPVTVAGRF